MDAQGMKAIPMPLDGMIKNHIIFTLKHTKGNRTHASRVLGISRSSIWRLIKQYKIRQYPPLR